MLARLLAALPSVTLARDLAVAREQVASCEARIAVLTAEALICDADHRALQRKYDRLVEARLFRTGDVNAPFTETPKTSSSAAQNPFGFLATSAYPAPVAPLPVGVDVAG